MEDAECGEWGFKLAPGQELVLSCPPRAVLQGKGLIGLQLLYVWHHHGGAAPQWYAGRVEKLLSATPDGHARVVAHFVADGPRTVWETVLKVDEYTVDPAAQRGWCLAGTKAELERAGIALAPVFTT